MTDFLDSLDQINHTLPATAAVEASFATKGITGYRDRELGCITDEDDPNVLYYYYYIDDGVLELRTGYESGRVNCWVSDFITDPTELADMVGVDKLTPEQRALFERRRTRMHPGFDVDGTVANVRDDIGIFVRMHDDVVGLVSLRALDLVGVERPSAQWQPGDKIRVKILRVDNRRNRVVLSLLGVHQPSQTS